MIISGVSERLHLHRSSPIRLLTHTCSFTQAVRAIRHPERYGPRAGNAEFGSAGAGYGPQSRARGLTRAILDTFPIVKFDRADGTGPDDLPAKDVEASREPDRKDSEASLDIELRDLPAVAAILEGDRSEKKEAVNGVEQEEREVPNAYGRGEEARAEGSSPTSTPHVQLRIPAPRQRIPAGRQEASASSAISTGDDGLVPDAIGRETCPICIVDFEEGDDLRVLPCEGHHRFHQQCVDQWLLELSGSCPICRQGTSSSLAFDVPVCSL